jgi:hypothetical protein
MQAKPHPNTQCHGCERSAHAFLKIRFHALYAPMTMAAMNLAPRRHMKYVIITATNKYNVNASAVSTLLGMYLPHKLRQQRNENQLCGMTDRRKLYGSVDGDKKGLAGWGSCVTIATKVKGREERCQKDTSRYVGRAGNYSNESPLETRAYASRRPASVE